MQNVFEQVVQAIDRLLAVLAVDVGRNVVHRARPVERDHGDDVFEPVGLQPLEAFAHARRFQLEDADRIGAGQQIRSSLRCRAARLARSSSIPRPD